MSNISYDWDVRKNKSNERKHGIRFDEAQTVFSDDLAKIIFDFKNSKGEDRYSILGMSTKLRLITDSSLSCLS